MRFFFSGPRIFGIRPGIILGANDFRRVFARSSQSATGNMTGSFVYVIEGESGHHKIGVSRDPIRRLADLQTGSHVRLKFAYIGVTPGTGYDIEQSAHQLLDAHRKEGEWFLVPASIAIGATLEAASRLGEPIQQVPPETVPQIIFLANQPDPSTRGWQGRWCGIFNPLPWYIRWPAVTIVATVCGVGIGLMIIVVSAITNSGSG